MILKDYREAFRRSDTVKRDQGFFLCGQMLDFLHRLLRRIVSRESLPEENDWDALLGFEFIDAQLLSVSQFMEKTEFRSKALRAAERRINVEKGKSKKSKTDVIASAVMGDMFNSHVNQGRAYIRYVCSELLKHPTFKSNLVVGLACFDYSVLFTLPRGQAMDCYARLVQSFYVRGWLAKELKNVHMDNNLEFIDDLWLVYLDELHIVIKSGIVQTKIHLLFFSNCVVCIWGILYQNRQMCRWVRLIEVVVQLIWQILLSLSSAIC